jgi:hypothetical protein
MAISKMGKKVKLQVIAASEGGATTTSEIHRPLQLHTLVLLTTPATPLTGSYIPRTHDRKNTTSIVQVSSKHLFDERDLELGNVDD